MMTPKDFIIMCDFDDTINQLIPAWVSWINSTYGYTVDCSDVVDWDLTKVFVGLTQDDICTALHSADFWQSVPAKKDAPYYIKKLIEDGFSFYICTSTDYRLVQPKFDNCLFRLLPFFDRHNIITTYNKQLMRCDVLIDDGAHNIDGPYHGLLIDMPHNQHIRGKNIRRVYNWKEIYANIHQLFAAKTRQSGDIICEDLGAEVH